jgi:hypothetical protein
VLEQLLEGAGLARGGAWSGGRARLLFLGDLFDRGPDGLGCLELIMRLQQGAAAAGGWVEMLVGNHDLLLLAAYHFGDAPSGGPGETFRGDWKLNGGVDPDLAGLTAAQIAWLSTRPALLCAEGTLYLHGDTTLYENLGESVEAVNAAFGALMAGRDADLWDALLEAFSEHGAFFREDGADRARRLLRRFGGQRLVHAHTPISKLTGQADATVSAPLHYADGLCTDIDHGLYRGGPGSSTAPSRGLERRQARFEVGETVGAGGGHPYERHLRRAQRRLQKGVSARRSAADATRRRVQ